MPNFRLSLTRQTVNLISFCQCTDMIKNALINIHKIVVRKVDQILLNFYYRFIHIFFTNTMYIIINVVENGITPFLAELVLQLSNFQFESYA